MMCIMKETNNSNILDLSICYLAGPIDYAEDLGVGYRQKILSLAKEKGLNIKFLDPTNKLTGLQDDIGQEQDSIQRYKKRGHWKALTKLMKKIVRSDLRQVDLSDFVIVKVDVGVHQCGTYHELIQADIQKKPVLVIIEGGKEKAPSWLFGIIDYKLMFSTEEECVDYLVRVNSGEEDLDDRWVLFRKELDEEL